MKNGCLSLRIKHNILGYLFVAITFRCVICLFLDALKSIQTNCFPIFRVNFIQLFCSDWISITIIIERCIIHSVRIHISILIKFFASKYYRLCTNIFILFSSISFCTLFFPLVGWIKNLYYRTIYIKWILFVWNLTHFLVGSCSP